MSWAWLFNLFFWLPYRTVAVRMTLEDGFHRKRRTAYFRVEKFRHRER
jgi:hypothetical protein